MKKRIGMAMCFGVAAVLVAHSGASAADWDAGGGAAWEALLEAGRSEGSLVIAGPPQLARPLAEAFEADTGIAVQYIVGGFRDLRTRFERELEAGKPTIDIHFGGSSALANKAAGLLALIKAMLVLPNVTDPANWKDGDPGWIDTGREYVLSPNAYVSGRVFVNNEAVDVDSIKVWQDLLRPEFKGKIASHDPSFGGAGQTLATYLLDELGEEFVRDFYKGQETQFSRESRQLVEWLVRGVYPIVVGAIAIDVERYRDEGIKNISILEMDDAPGYIVGGSAVTATPKEPPHPNAAAVFHNWYLSTRGQQLYVDEMQVPSRRLDVNNDGIPFYVRATEGRSYVNFYEETFYLGKRLPLRAALKELLGE